MRQFELSPTPRACFAVDKASDDLFRTRHTRRSDQRQSRTAGGKRAVKTATDLSASTGQTPRLSEDRSVSPGGSRQDGSDLETSAFPRPARDASGLASGALPLVLQAQIESTLKQPSALVRDHHFDPGEGSKQPTLGS